MPVVEAGDATPTGDAIPSVQSHKQTHSLRVKGPGSALSSFPKRENSERLLEVEPLAARR